MHFAGQTKLVLATCYTKDVTVDKIQQSAEFSQVK